MDLLEAGTLLQENQFLRLKVQALEDINKAQDRMLAELKNEVDALLLKITLPPETI